MGSSENLVTNSASSTNGGILPLSLLDSASLSAALSDDSALSSLQIKLRTPNGSDPISSGLSRQEKLTATTDDLNFSKSSQNSSNNQNNSINYLNNYSPLFKNQQNSSLIPSQQSEITKSNNKTGFDRLTGVTTNTPLINIATSDPVLTSLNNSLSIPSLLPDILPPTLSAIVLPLNLLPGSPQARLVGIVNGTGSAIASLTVAFDNLAAGPISVSPLGAFDHALDFTGLNDGPHTFTVKATDVAGNFSTASFSLTVNLAATPPTILAALAHDTAPDGTTNTDGITFDPTTTGTVKVVNRGIFINALTTVTPIVNAVANVSLTETNQIVSLKAGFDNTQVANYLDVIADLHSDGSFTLSRNRLNTIFGGTLPDGHHTLHLQAVDKYNIANNFDISFTLDTTTAVPTINLSANSDTGLSNSDRITLDTTPTIVGTAEALARVQLFNNGQLKGQTTATLNGTWQITTSELTDGVYGLNAIATDIAGNTKTSAAIDVTIDNALPQVSLSTPINQSSLYLGDKLTGSVDGTGSAVTALSYRFDNLQNISLNFNANGRFDQVLDFTGLNNGEHTLTIAATDTAGNIKTIQYAVTVIIDREAPVISASLLHDTAPNGQTNSDRITFDPTITGTVIDASRVVEFKAGFDNTLAGNFTNVTAFRNADGSFTFEKTALETIYGGTLPDGFHTMHLQAVDEFHNTSNIFDFSFTFDSTTSEPIFNLNAVSDSGVVGDLHTKFDTVTLTGLAEANSTVVLEQTGAVTTSDNNGQFTFAHVLLAIGDNSLIARSTDIAGNQNTFSTSIYRFSPPTAINLTGNTVAENSSTGIVIGQLTSTDPDAGDTHTYILEDNANGRFRIVGNQLQVADGKLLNFESGTQHSVTVTSTDASGLSLTQVFAIAVKNVNEAPSFTSTPISIADSGSLYTYNIIAADPDAGDSLRFTTDNLPSWLTLVDNLDGTATLRGTPKNFLDNINSNIHLKVTDASGLTAIQDFTIAPTTSFTENNNFAVSRSLSLTIPATPSYLSFKINPQFDTTAVNSINDAIDVALVDANGNSLVHTVGSGRDAFFNWTQGESTALGVGTSYDAATGTVSLNLTGITPGTNAQLVFRLVNDDGDVTTSVRITDFALTTAPDGTQAPVQTDFDKPISQTTAPNFNLLTDVSSSTSTEYHRTSFNADTHLLYADIAFRNIGSYSVDSRLIVAVNHLSDPTVLVRNPDGFTPDGIPYYDFSKLVGDTKFDPNELTPTRTFVFYNPQGVQFTYDLTVLAQLNTAPVIQTQANKEVIGGHNYTYDVDATDPNGDSLTYKLLIAPDGMTIDQATGLISWNTATSNIGNSSVLVEVGDGRGGVAQQQYSLSVIDAPPNRPPVFTSTPIVDAAINTNYTYQALAKDADLDNLTFSLLNSPVGMTINGNTGEINWIPTAISFPRTALTVRVTDSRGSFADQSFNINVQPVSGNHSPIIVSEPITQVNVFNSASNPNSKYSYSVQAIDPDNDFLNYSLVSSPTGMSIDSSTGNISWINPSASTTPYNVTVQVQDGRGGVNTQSYQLFVTNNLPGKIYGSVFQDLDENGIRGGSGILIPNDSRIQIDPFYANNYSAYDIGRPASISQVYINGPVFKPLDPNTLTVMTAGISRGDDRIYEIKVIRGEGDHIIGFGEANLVLKLGDSDNGLFAYAPNGTLFTGRYDNTLWQTKPGSTKADKVIDFNQLGLPFITGIEIVPSGLPGEGQLKLVSWPNGAVYTAKLIPDGMGTYNIESPKLEAVAGYASYNLNYIPVSSPLFDVPSTLAGEYRSILWSTDGRRTSAYEIDGNGNPILLTRRDFIQNINPAGGSFDPITGDYVSLVQHSSPLPTGDLIVVRGFNPISPTEIGIPDWLVYIDSNDNGRRDLNETFTIADDKGNYSFTLDPGSYKISLDLQSGWAFTGPTNGSYSVNLASDQVVSKQDFGITNNRLNGAPNLDPTFVSTAPTVATSGEQFLYPAKATDLNGDILEYDLSVKPSGMVVSSQGVVSWEPTTEQVGVHNVVLRVQDGHGGVDLQVFQVVVSLGNIAPIFTTSTPLAYQPQIGQLFQYQAQALDADGDAITYRLITNPYTPAGATVDSNTGLVRWIPEQTQLGRPHPYVTWQIILAANDGHGGETFQIISFQDVVNSATNDAPLINSTPRSNIALGQNYIYAIQASDPNYDPLTITLETAPQGMIIDPQGRIIWQPTATQLGSNPVSIKVSDGRGGVVTQVFNIDVVSSTIRTNNAPSITSTPNLITNLERTYEYNLSGTDSDGDLLLWSLDNAPAGMVIDAQSGALRWQPQKDQIGEHNVVVRLTDAYGLDVAQEFTLHVTGVNTPSAIVSNPITRAAQNQLYTYTVVATDPENDPLTFSLGTKPAGMDIDDNGTIRWTPQASQIGSQQVEVFARDAQGAVTTQTYTVEVGATAINTAPSITSTPVYLAAVGSPYSYQVVATDPDAGDRLTYQLLSVPPGVTGITIDPSTGLLTWANPVAGNYKIVVGAVDAAGLGAAQGFTLTARENHAPIIKSNPLITATPGSTYNYDIIASDADGDRLTYSLDQASRDLGMTLDTLGRLRWTPTAGNVGSHTVVITVNDANGGTGQQQYNLSVAADSVAPKVRLIANYDLVNLGESITFQARATDNIKVAGLQLLIDGTAVVLDGNGMATFKPTTAGTITAKAIAKDTAGNIGEATFSVAVIDTSDVNAPEVSLNLSAIAGGLITAPVDIKGSISDDGSLDYYRLLVAPVAGGEFKEIAFVDNPTAIANGVLGKFDPSLLQNDSYILRLEVADNGGHISYADEVVDVAGDLKLGNFRLSFTDLTVPVTGIPITLTRTYDSLNSGSTDDFGYGWRMEFRDTDLRTSLRTPSEEEQLVGYQSAFKDGTKVYITLPGGKREAFTFKPTIDPIFNLAAAFAGTSEAAVYRPKFVGDKGVTSTLTVKDARILHKAGSNEYVGLNGGINYNPADVNFGSVYVLTTKEGIVYEIDAATGDLLTVTDTNGNKLTYTEGGIYSSTGKQVTFERDAQGRIASVKDPMGELVRYEYNAKGDLVSVTDQEKFKTQFVYDQERSHYLKEIIDPLNRAGAKVEYGDDGRLKKTLNATGNSVEIDYDPANSLQTVKDALGNPTTYEYDTRGNVIRVVDALGHQTQMIYDDENNLLQVTDANNLVTKYEYDDKGNLKSRTEQYCGCATVVPGTSYYTYDKYGNITSLVTPTGASMTMDYDRFGNMLAMKDGLGNVIQSFTYNGFGQVETETDSTGTITYQYDDFGNVIKTIDADGSATTMEYYADGKLKRMVEDNSTPNDTSDDEISTFEYDKLGREKFADYGDGIWVKYDYEGAGGDWTKLEAPTIGKIERKLTADGKLAGWVTADGGTPTFKYDLVGRLWRETDTSGNDITEYGYDAAGRLTTVKDLRTGATTTKKYDAGGRTTEEIDVLNVFTRYFYDPKSGKLTSTERGKYIKDTSGQLVEDPTVQKQVYRYEYNGLQTTVIDPLNRRTTSVMNDYYLPTETIYTTGQKEKISYLYANNLQEAKDYPTKIVDIGGNDRDFTYDELGRLKTATDLGNSKYTYDYGDDGLAKITSLTGEILQYGYDDLGNLAKVTYGDSTFKQMTYSTTDNRLETVTLPSGETITYQYNDAGQVTSQTSSTTGAVSFTYTEEGAVKTMTDSTGTTTYRYDSNDRLEGMDYANGSSISYTYDIVGRIKTLTEKGSATATAYTTEYDYDAFGNLSWVKDPAGGITRMNYDVVNRLQERTLPNSVKTTYEYDDLDRVKSIVHTNAQGQVLASVTYERQGIGEPSKITREDGSYVKLEYDSALRVEKESYYNVAGQLLNETSYTYDASGKRQVQSTSGGDRTFNYSAGYQLDTVTEAGETENYDYDQNGRLTLIERDGKTLDLEHDAYDRLTIVENQTTGETTQYIYDGAGNRVKEIQGNQERRFLVAPAMGGGLQSTDLITDGGGNLISNYIYGGGSSPFMRLDANGNAVYYLTDAMGSVIGLADGSGASSGKFLYDAFGNVLSQVGGTNSSAGGDFRFQGQWLEEDTGLYNFGARDYDPGTGLFLSRDPVDIIDMEPESFNPYQFVYNNPYIYSDPTGMFTINDLNVAQIVNDTLDSIYKNYQSQVTRYAIDQAKGVVTDVLLSAFQQLLPFSQAGTLDQIAGDIKQQQALSKIANWENMLVESSICAVLNSGNYKDHVWKDVSISQTGEPQDDGYACGETPLIDFKDSKPDFIIKRGEPKLTDKNPKAYLIGDAKLNAKNISSNQGKEGNQFRAIMAYANPKNGHQYVPVATYITIFGDEKNEKKLEERALKSGVKLFVIDFFPQSSKK